MVKIAHQIVFAAFFEGWDVAEGCAFEDQVCEGHVASARFLDVAVVIDEFRCEDADFWVFFEVVDEFLKGILLDCHVDVHYEDVFSLCVFGCEVVAASVSKVFWGFYEFDVVFFC